MGMRNMVIDIFSAWGHYRIDEGSCHIEPHTHLVLLTVEHPKFLRPHGLLNLEIERYVRNKPYLKSGAVFLLSVWRLHIN